MFYYTFQTIFQDQRVISNWLIIFVYWNNPNLSEESMRHQDMELLIILIYQYHNLQRIFYVLYLTMKSRLYFVKHWTKILYFFGFSLLNLNVKLRDIFILLNLPIESMENINMKVNFLKIYACKLIYLKYFSLLRYCQIYR